MTLPSFLIIGSMKSGTTTLYRDLSTNPDIFMPEDKEPECLCHDAVLTGKGRADYENIYKKAKSGQACGEASTAYSKLPDYAGVASRALEVLGPDLKIIYLIRDPLKRIISQHYHEYSLNLVANDISQEVKSNKRYLNYSAYAMQIKPWIEKFGIDNVKIVFFEEYITNRVGIIGEICKFIGVEPRTDLINIEGIYNRSEKKPIVKGGWTWLSSNTLYRKILRPFIPWQLRSKIQTLILPKSPSRPAPPDESTIQYINESLKNDHEELKIILKGRKLPW